MRPGANHNGSSFYYHQHSNRPPPPFNRHNFSNGMPPPNIMPPGMMYPSEDMGPPVNGVPQYHVRLGASNTNLSGAPNININSNRLHPAQQLHIYIAGVTHDRNAKDMRHQMGQNLTQLLMHTDPNVFVNQNQEPFGYVYELDAVFYSKCTQDTKRMVADCIGVVAATILNDFTKFVRWALDNLNTNQTREDMRALYLRVLHSCFQSRTRIVSNGGMLFPDDDVKKVMEDTQSLLNDNDNADMLPLLLDIACDVAQHYTLVFEEYCTDVLDIIAGWCIDSSQYPSVYSVCENALDRMKHLIVQPPHCAFVIDIAKQFTEDAYSYAKDVREYDQQEAEYSTKELLLRIARLIKTFAVVLVHVAPKVDELAVLEKMLGNIVECMTLIVECTNVELDQCVAAIGDVFVCTMQVPAIYVETVYTTHVQLLRTLLTQSSLYSVKPSTINTLIDKFRMVSKDHTKLCTLYISKLIGPEGVLRAVRFTHEQQASLRMCSLIVWLVLPISSAVAHFYRTLCTPRDISLLQAVYGLMLSELKACVTCMSVAVGATVPSDSVFGLSTIVAAPDDNNEWMVNCTQLAQTVLAYILSCWTPLALAKNSLIVMHGLQPSLMDLLVCMLNADWLILYYPWAHYATVHLLLQHSLINEHFVPSSSLVQSTSNVVRPTASHTANILIGINRLIPMKHLINDTRILVVSFVHKFADCLMLHAGKDEYLSETLCANEEMKLLINNLLNSVGLYTALPRASVNAYVSCAHGLVLWYKAQARSSHYEINKSIMSCVRALCNDMNNNNTDYSSKATLLLNQLSLHELNLLRDGRNLNGSIQLEHQSIVNYCMISASAFSLLADTVIKAKPLTLVQEQFDNGLYNNCLQLILAETAGADRIKVTHLFESNGLMWQWVCWQLAMFCVGTRLKTPLGKPVNTFAFFEDEIKRLAQEAALDSQSFSAGEQKLTQTQQPGLEWWRVRHVLCVLEALHKAMYNAYTGCANALPPVTKAASTFFTTNSGTCIQWMHRTRVWLMVVCVHNQQYAQCIRLGTHLMQAAQTVLKQMLKAPHFDVFLVLMAESFYRCGDEYCLMGLQKWVQTQNEELYVDWMQAVVHCAGGRFEEALGALDSFVSVEEKKQQCSSNVLRFLYALMIDCYVSLRDFSPMNVQKLNEQLSGMDNGQSNARLNTHIHYVQSLATFTTMTNQHTANNGSSALCWSAVDQYRVAECELVRAATLGQHTPHMNIVRQVRERMQSLKEKQQVYGGEELDVDWSVLDRVCTVLGSTQQTGGTVDRLLQYTLPALSMSDHEGLHNIDTPKALIVCQQAAFWRQNLSGSEGMQQDGHYLSASILARKTGNLSLAVRQLASHLQTDTDNLAQLTCKIQQRAHDQSLTTQLLPLATHAAKLFIVKSGDVSSGFELLSSVVSSSVQGLQPRGHVLTDTLIQAVLMQCSQTSTNDRANVSSEARVSLSRALLCMAKWLQQDDKCGQLLLAESAPESLFIRLVEEQLSFAQQSLGVVLNSEAVVGSLLLLSSALSPEYIKAQRILADWAYRCGRKALDSRDEFVLLSSEELQRIDNSLPPTISSEQRKAIVKLVSTLRSDEHGTVCDSAQFQASVHGLCAHLSETNQESLTNIWLAANKRMFLFYDSAAAAYFSFLQFSEKTSIDTVTATLRLLRLLVKHSNDMHMRLHEQFANTHALTWVCVIPQLFARLNHRNPLVRDSLTGLLQRMAVLAPHLVCYQAVVGANTDDSYVHTMDNEQNEDEEDTVAVNDTTSQQEASLMAKCCERVVSTLQETDSLMLAHTQQYVKQLLNVTLLNEEKWLQVLTYLRHDMTKRFAQLTDETAKLQQNANLDENTKQTIILEKNVIFSTMVFGALEQLYVQTCTERDTQSANERSFMVMFKGTIRRALDLYQTTPNQPKQAWDAFEQLHGTLQQRSNRRVCLVHELGEISPWLAKLQSSRVPLAGQQLVVNKEDVLYIDNVHSVVNTLPTKTRPKKFTFCCQDGKQYPYLFKGMEDLHLDERVMQLIQVCNLMLSRGSQGAAGTGHTARHYSVTPTAARSGLIRWVQGATPLFQLYRKWQHRESVKSGKNEPATRPSDLYRAKMLPALEKKGIRDTQNRAKWPLSVQRQVLQQLQQDTPDDLLARELWCRSLSAPTWWQLTRTWARSCALMSVIGHVLGLGDRHLDNLLVDIHTGEIVHIDYNICFDKGRQLRVPETVPFRMTQNMICALGPTGVEGIFRHSCESVLSVLRSGRETLLTLLEAFVYDPLVDWTVSGDSTHSIGPMFLMPQVSQLISGGVQSKTAEASQALHLAHRLFAVRRTEIQHRWILNRDSVQSALCTVMEQLTLLCVTHVQLSAAKAQQHRLEENMALADLLTSDQMAESGSLSEIEHQVNVLQEQLTEYANACTLHAQLLRQALHVHHTLMTDMRIVLKCLAKLESQAASNADRPNLGVFGAYVVWYKTEFIDVLAKCLVVLGDSQVLQLALDHALAEQTSMVFTKLYANVPRVYDGLLCLDSHLQHAHEWPSLGASDTGKPPGTDTGNDRTGKVTPVPNVVREDRNAQGMQVWRRIRQKLDGRTDQHMKRVTVHDQVEQMIAEATDLDNLSVMYEGWTAWV